MFSGERFRINSPNVVHQTVDNEAILINLETGVYYSLNPTGSAIWNWLAQLASPAQILDSLSTHYPNADSISRDLSHYLSELIAERLIVPVETNGKLPGLSATTLNGSYQPPQFERYTDMQEIILLDPIHDVDATGWPVPKV